MAQKQFHVTRAAIGRLPLYLQYLRSSASEGDYISAAAIARGLGLGEVQVRKDLAAVSGMGKPKIGYLKKKLVHDLEAFLRLDKQNLAVIAGAGSLGKALMGFDGFAAYGLKIAAAFDCSTKKIGQMISGRPVLPIEQLRSYCQLHDIRIGIITVPEAAAQDVCNRMIDCGITAVWNFAPVVLKVPDHILLQQENLALSLAHLNILINHK